MINQVGIIEFSMTMRMPQVGPVEVRYRAHYKDSNRIDLSAQVISGTIQLTPGTANMRQMIAAARADMDAQFTAQGHTSREGAI